MTKAQRKNFNRIARNAGTEFDGRARKALLALKAMGLIIMSNAYGHRSSYGGYVGVRYICHLTEKGEKTRL